MTTVSLFVFGFLVGSIATIAFLVGVAQWEEKQDRIAYREEQKDRRR